MPHPNARRKVCSTLDDAFAYLNRTHENRRLWTVLKFDTSWGKYYAFYSTSNVGQQMHGIAKTILQFSGHYGRGMPHGRQLAIDIGDRLKGYDAGSTWGGHAEEHMIEYYQMCLNECQSPPRSVIIWNSDTPCRTADRQPSDNMTGWPKSCLSKLNRLAAVQPRLMFMVYIYRAFGALAGQMPANAAAILNVESTSPNIRFLPFTSDLNYVLRNYHNIR